MQEQKLKTTAKDFFLHLAVIVALYVSTISFVNLLFEIIDKRFPDLLNGGYYDPYGSGVRLAIASLIVVVPIFLVLSRFLEKNYRDEPQKRGLSIRRWLLVLTLFLSGSAIAVDLIAVVRAFLEGEITARFVLKALSVFLAAGLIFGYYLSDLRDRVSHSGRKWWAVGVAALVMISIALGFVVFGSPAEARARRFDSQRVSHLQEIQWRIVNFWQQKNRLPSGLSDLNDPISNFIVPSDPETKEMYNYEIVVEGKTTSFRLCATFRYGSAETSGRAPYPAKSIPVAINEGVADNWEHAVGRVCFDRSIDPELYPPRVDKIR